MKNFYEVLGVPNSASKAEIKQAYKKLSMKVHPDKNGNDPFFNDLFKNINEAYSTLIDERKKVLYDKSINDNQNFQYENEDIYEEEEKTLNSLIFDAASIFIVNKKIEVELLTKYLDADTAFAFQLIDQLNTIGIIDANDWNQKRLVKDRVDAIKIFRSQINDFDESNFIKIYNLHSKISVDQKPKKKANINFKILALFLLILGCGFFFFKKFTTSENKNLTNLKSGIVTAKKGLKLRKEPNLNSKTLKVIKPGKVVKIISKTDSKEIINGNLNNWILVYANETEGWVWGYYIKEVK